MRKILPFLLVIALLIVACEDNGGPSYGGEVGGEVARRDTSGAVEKESAFEAAQGLGIQPKYMKKIEVKTADVAAEIANIWLEHNILWQETQGMIIHIDFSIFNSRNREGMAAAYFYFADGTPLKDFNGRYKTKNGNVSVGEDFVPDYEGARFPDFQIFMPYDELHMDYGTFSLKFRVSIWGPASRELAKSDWVGFTFTRR